jgi:hypothetical protein
MINRFFFSEVHLTYVTPRYYDSLLFAICYFRDVMGSDHTLITEVEKAGLDQSEVEELKKQLTQYSFGKH